MGVVYIRDIRARLEGKGGDLKYYKANLTQSQLERHNNFAMVSIGLTVPEDLKAATLTRWVNQGIAHEVGYEEWNHSGCQSSCKLRGANECRW